MNATHGADMAQLAEAFNFAETDVSANRLGQLSERQQTEIAHQARIGRALFIFIGLVFIAFAFIPNEEAGSLETLRVLFTTGRPPAGLPTNAVITWLCVQLPIAGLVGCLAIGLTFWEQDNTVRRVAGPIQLQEIKSRKSQRHPNAIRTPSYALQVANELFTLTSAQAQALVPNRPYAVYYRKQAWATFIYSVEPLPDSGQS